MTDNEKYAIPICNAQLTESNKTSILDPDITNPLKSSIEKVEKDEINEYMLLDSPLDEIPKIQPDLLHIQGTTHTAKSRIYTIDTIEQASIVDDIPLMGHTSLDEGGCDYIQHCRCMPKRYVLTILSFLGFFNVYCLRVDLSVALVAMTTNHTKIRFDGTEYKVSF